MDAGAAAQPRVVMSGLAFPESPRWHEGRLWFSDWGADQVIALDADGRSEVVARVASFPMCIDHTPDGRLLIVSSDDRRLLRMERDGSITTLADLGGLSDHPWNDIAVTSRGDVYVNNIGFDFPAGEVAPGMVALITNDGSARQVADGLMFPNGMVVTPDDSTLIVAESYGNKLTAFDILADGSLSGGRPWAPLDGYPDGICLDAEGAAWYADVPNKRCVRVRAGGEVLQTIDLDRGCFACALGGPRGTTLFMLANEWQGADAIDEASRMGEVLALQVRVPAA